MKRLTKRLVASSALITALLTAACSPKQEPTPVVSSEQTATDQQQQSKQQQPPATEFIEIEGYKFKLEPDVQADGVAHLDFYVRDMAGKHVKGVTGDFKITKPDGTKADLPIKEEPPHDHYHGMIKLDQPGEYLIVAQVSVADKKLNPRFSFTRKL